MQDNLKLLEEYMKYFGKLKLQLKDNSQKRRRVIVTPLLLRRSFRLGQLPCDSTRYLIFICLPMIWNDEEC